MILFICKTQKDLSELIPPAATYQNAQLLVISNKIFAELWLKTIVLSV